MNINYSNPVNYELKNYSEKPKIYDLGFREYDARWLYPDQINLPGIQMIGLGLGCLIKKNKNNKQICVGHDSRSYSFEVKESLISGLIASGIDVIDLGLTISPAAYFAQYYLNCDNVAMVTASHNPNGWTGIKMGNEKTLTFGPKLIGELKNIIREKNIKTDKPGTYTFKNINEEYINDIIERYSISRKIK